MQEDAVLDGADVFAGICRACDLPMLNRVDPYGDLILTSQDMPELLADIDVVVGAGVAEAERSVLAAVRALAQRCVEESSLELHLEGD
ncbi:hypothetical protein DY218_05745 [Streptomyces triticagri]|uniref:Uncharacterized protein n=1 Tax=Streptomyces triticagri TaxID=2293568 RepID=A0A372MA09_9ACTN|nr:hypothetical protein DY218_05745 [Streptomyces triticagri]